jgi:hypothetical protein
VDRCDDAAAGRDDGFESVNGCRLSAHRGGSGAERRSQARRRP